MGKIINCIDRKINKQVGSIEFKNISNDVGEIYIYGTIISSSYKWDDSDVTLSEFKEQLDEFKDMKNLDIFINSPGGSVTTGVSMLNLLKRHNATKNVYIDALSASIASVLMMSYDNLYVYPTSMAMIHKPMIGLMWGANADDLRKQAEDLDRIEENMIIPAYLEKATDELTEESLKDMLKAETWIGAKDIQKYFKNVTILEDEKELVACIKDKEILNIYKNTPQELLRENKKDVVEESEEVKNLKAKLLLELVI